MLRLVRKTLDLLSRLLPETCCIATHEQRPEILGGSCQVQEVPGVKESEDLRCTFQCTKHKYDRLKLTSNRTSKGIFGMSCRPPRRTRTFTRARATGVAFAFVRAFEGAEPLEERVVFTLFFGGMVVKYRGGRRRVVVSGCEWQRELCALPDATA